MPRYSRVLVLCECIKKKEISNSEYRTRSWNDPYNLRSVKKFESQIF